MRLLADLRDLFTTTRADRLATAVIVRHLRTLEDRPWADCAQGQPLTPRRLAQLLDGFRIKAKQIRQGDATRKGYVRSDFTEAFRRYLPGPTPRHGLIAVAVPQGGNISGERFREPRAPSARPMDRVSDVSDTDARTLAGLLLGSHEYVAANALE